eukprot:m.241395 g.241395  ORF g.241395 m.241395 type:complete len:177 (-) comp33773_c3_seq1:138-668(-)
MALYALGGVAFTAVFFIRKASFSKWKMVEYDAKTGDVHKCLFCDIARQTGDPGLTQLLAENGELVAFRPRSPSAANHILVVPKHHIRNAVDLTASNRQLLINMMDWGKTLLQDHPTTTNIAHDEEPRFVFHLSPINSVDHLHLHCILPPFTDGYHKVVYNPSMPWCSHAHDVLSSL